tara:strand:+ start:496 stop:1257 length:762 start_codon:yes stop_codon:yes gene_type:complete
MAKSKVDKSQVKEKNVEVVENEESTLYYFYSVGCGFCKKAEPIIDELIKEGHDILKLDVAEPDNNGLKQELEKKYNKRCGTPWFIDGKNGNDICGYREKDIIQKWIDGEEIPAPPRPKSQMPRPPFHGAAKKDEKSWIVEYTKWTEENSHLPNLQTAEQILARPRPKSDPPRPPVQGADDKTIDIWVKEYDKWKDENSHLPNLQPGNVIAQRFKQGNQPQVGAPGANLNPDQNARLNRLEQKMDKLIKHLGVK